MRSASPGRWAMATARQSAGAYTYRLGRRWAWETQAGQLLVTGSEGKQGGMVKHDRRRGRSHSWRVCLGLLPGSDSGMWPVSSSCQNRSPTVSFVLNLVVAQPGQGVGVFSPAGGQRLHRRSPDGLVGVGVTPELSVAGDTVRVT
jgi:hypothetical protein